MLIMKIIFYVGRVTHYSNTHKAKHYPLKTTHKCLVLERLTEDISSIKNQKANT